MITPLLEALLEEMRRSLTQRGHWPVEWFPGYDLADPEVLAELRRTADPFWPLAQAGCPLVARCERDLRAIRRAYGLPTRYRLSIGAARPGLVWLSRARRSKVAPPVPPVHRTKLVDYLALEEIIAVLRRTETVR